MTAPEVTVAARAFLTGRPSTAIALIGTERVEGMVVSVRDTAGLFPDGLLVFWPGPDSMAFLRNNSAELVPGRCVDLQLYHFRTSPNAVRARTTACAMAPLAPSWIAHQEKLAATTEQPA